MVAPGTELVKSIDGGPGTELVKSIDGGPGTELVKSIDGGPGTEQTDSSIANKTCFWSKLSSDLCATSLRDAVHWLLSLL